MVETATIAPQSDREAHQAASSLSPARRALADHLAAVAAAGDEIAKLQAPARRLQDAAAAEAEADAELTAIANAEADAMRLWAESDPDAPMPEPLTKRRAAAGQKLARAKALSAAARSAGADVNDRLNDACRRHAALVARTTARVADVLLERAAALAALVNGHVTNAGALMTEFAALSEHLHKRQHPDDPSSFAPGAAMRAMQPALPIVNALLTDVPVARVDQSLARWAALADALTRDPSAS